MPWCLFNLEAGAGLSLLERLCQSQKRHVFEISKLGNYFFWKEWFLIQGSENLPNHFKLSIWLT